MGHLFSTVDCSMPTFGQTILWVTLTPTAKSSLRLFKTVYNIYKDISMLQMTSRHFNVIICQRPIFMQPSLLAKAVKNADQQEQKYITTYQGKQTETVRMTETMTTTC